MGSSGTEPTASNRPGGNRARGVATFRVGAEWLALPTADVASLHWRGLGADHCDPGTGACYLRSGTLLVPLLDLWPLTRATRRGPHEFVLVVRNRGGGVEPALGGLLVEEFGEVCAGEGQRDPLPESWPWWSPFLHVDHPGRLVTGRGPVPVLCAARLLAAATQWSRAGSP